MNTEGYLKHIQACIKLPFSAHILNLELVENTLNV